MASPMNAGEISTLASECRQLFRKCSSANPWASNIRRDAASFYKDYETWCFNLGVFAAPAVSLDQTLRYSDEVRGFVTQLLLILRRNLEFIAVKTHDRSTTLQPNEKKDNVVQKLQGSSDEALRAISAVLQRLDRLGATIRKYSASSLSSRVKAFAEQENDEKYRMLASNILAYQYPTATSSLQVQLADSMANRRLRLRYIRQHQRKTAPKDQQNSITQDHHETDFSSPKATNHRSSRPTTKNAVAVIRNQIASKPRGDASRQGTETTPSTTAWTFRPTSSAMERVRLYGSKSVISSSAASSTRMIGGMNEYPEPPTHEKWSQDPECPTCWRQLKESELKGRRWRLHVDTDCEPYVCISEDCKQPPQFFSDFKIWEHHMRNRHSTRWTELVHKPTLWICDVDHDDEQFQDHKDFQEHLRNKHSNLSEAELKAVATLSVTAETRAKHTCPLCGHNPASEQDGRPESASSMPQKSEVDELAKLAQHIGGHLRYLAFRTLDHLDSDQESISEQDLGTTSGKAQSRSRAPSGLRDLEDASSGFLDDDDIRSVSTFDGVETGYGDAIPDMVPILPECVEGWEGILKTKPIEEDMILRNMAAYSAWDKAYDNLKRTEPHLLEKYELLLSKELVIDPEEDSKPVIKLFRDTDIRSRQVLFRKIADKLLKRIRDTCEANQVTGSAMRVLNWLTDFATGPPSVSLPLVGFCLALILLANFETSRGDDWRKFVALISQLPRYLALELKLGSLIWTSTGNRTRELIDLERYSLQLCRKMFELQVRIAVFDDQLEDPSRLLYNIEGLDREVMERALAANIDLSLPPMQDGRQWTEATMFELVTACNQVVENIRLLGDVLRIDPRIVKSRIEILAGELVTDISSWVLGHGTLHQLQNDPQTRLLWIHGLAGSGKTMLLCGMIDQLPARFKVVPYFFCMASNPSLNHGTAVLCGLLYLLSCARPSLISKYNLLREQLAQDVRTWEGISTLFSTIVKDPVLDGAVLVVDALDECQINRASLLRLISTPSRVKWILSSRDLPDIAEGLGGVSKVTLQFVVFQAGMHIVIDGDA